MRGASAVVHHPSQGFGRQVVQEREAAAVPPPVDGGRLKLEGEAVEAADRLEMDRGMKLDLQG
jgi:hypothetical protein